jgi:hypothetical protein
MRTILSLLLFLMMTPAYAECLVVCEDEDMIDLPDDEARARLHSILGAPLPDGLTITAMREVGFQDIFYQARLTGDATAVKALLAIGGETTTSLRPELREFGPQDTDWWDIANRADLRSTAMHTPTLRYLNIGVASEAAGFVIYVWAYGA